MTYDQMEAERYRMRHAIAINPDKPLRWVINTYMIRTEVANEFLDSDTDDTEVMVAKKTKRANKYAVLEQWLDENVGKTVSHKEIAKATNFSNSTIRKYIAKNVTRFHKVAPAQWEIRNPKAEREQAKKGNTK